MKEMGASPWTTESLLTRCSLISAGFAPDSELAQPDDKFEKYVFLGFLSYLAATCRLDLKAPLNALAQWTTKWNTHCTLAAKHLARYLVKTRTLGLKWQLNNSLANKVIGFSDFGSHKADRSMGGYVIMLNGAAVISRAFSIKQVVTSTGAGEARALFECVVQLGHTLNLVNEFGFCQDKLSNPIFCDSQTVLASVLGDKKLKRSKQYAIYVNYVKEKVQLGLIHLRYCESSLQCADIMTKVTFPSSHHFVSLRNMAMGHASSNVSEMEHTGKIIAISETVVDKFGRPLYLKNGIRRSYDEHSDHDLNQCPSSSPSDFDATATEMAERSDMAESATTESVGSPNTGVVSYSTPDQESTMAE